MKYLKWIKTYNFNARNKTIIITGANSGIGFFASMYLAHLGANVIMACRNKTKAEIAKEKIKQTIPDAKLFIENLDISSKKSIYDFVNVVKNKYNSFDILVNNAGIYMPKEEKTIDGYNATIGTNFVGTMILTDCLKPLLKINGRIVFVTSLTDIFSRYDKSDPLGYNSKNKSKDYGRSKLYISNFAQTLLKDQELINKNISILTMHPGISATNIFSSDKTSFGKIFEKLGKGFLKVFTHSPEKASLGIIYASLKPEIQKTRIAPKGLFGISGFPKEKQIPKRIRNNANAIIESLNIEIEKTYKKTE